VIVVGEHPTALGVSGAPAVASLCDALEAVSARLAALMRTIEDPSPPAVGVWTIGETAAHVSGSGSALLRALRGGPPERVDDLAAANARALAGFPERDPRRLADRLESGDAELVAHARRIGGDPLTRPFEGVDVPLSAVLSIELGELLVHGFDIARAAERPWSIEAEHAGLALRGYLLLLPFLLDRAHAEGVRLALDLRVRGMVPVLVRVADGALGVEPALDQPVDAHISVDPAACLLLVWNRIPPWQPLIRGQLVVWGRRPWRAGELAGLVVS
jgi:uncharacterized protein (TIGR03083 family)